MKHILFRWLMPALSAMVCCTWTCRADDASKNAGGEPAWQQQMEHAQNYCANQSGEWPLYLQSYRKTGTVKSEKHKSSLIDRMLSDKSFMLLPAGNSPQFIVRKKKELARAARPRIGKKADITADRRFVLQNGVKTGMTVLKLNWLYEGRKITSTAIADESGILYDNIGSFCMKAKVPGGVEKIEVLY